VSTSTQGDFSRVFTSYAWVLGVVFALALGAIAYVVLHFRSGRRSETSAVTGNRLAEGAAIAYQWGWEFDYPGTAIRVVGENGAPPVLVLPAGRTVQVSLRTRDVIHSFWVPALRYKRDAMPGVAGRFDIVVPLGDHPGSCALFCGLHHAEMRFSVRGVGATAWASFLERGGPQ
jgi:cytochrome c oxidase subunit II